MTTRDVLVFAWKSSGGFRALVKSFDFWVATLVWAIACPFWLTPKWPDQVISVLPNILGFTVGGFAIFLSFGNDNFKGVLAAQSEAKSTYLSVSAAFILFVSVQLTALMWALGASALYFETPSVLRTHLPAIEVGAKVGGAIGYWLFTYGLALVFRAAVRIFRLSRWHNFYLSQVASQQAAAPES